MRLRHHAMIKNPRRAARPHRCSAVGLSHPSRNLAISRSILQAAKRRARRPMEAEFFMGPQSRPVMQYNIKPYRKLFKYTAQVPRIVFQPVIPEVDVAAVYAHKPDLAEFPLNAIRRALGAGPPNMWGKSLPIFFAEPPLAIIPKEMEVVMDDYSAANGATHILAVYPSTQQYPYSPAERITWRFRYRREILLYPVHSVIFVAHCTKFPPIPESDPVIMPIDTDKPDLAVQTSVKLPVIPLRVPHIDTFPLVMQYLYTYNWKQFGFNLVPLPMPELLDNDPTPDNPGAPFMHVNTLRHALPFANLIGPSHVAQALSHIWGVYHNMIALGIADKKMWQVLCFCWDTVMVAEELNRHKARRALMAGRPDLTNGILEMEGGKLSLRSRDRVKNLTTTG